MLARHHAPTSVQQKARVVLRSLVQAGRTPGVPLRAEDVFPVPLERVISEVLGWNLEEVSVIELTEDRCVHGRCDHAQKTIFLSTDVPRSRGERNFSLAHEIGHAVLHSENADRERPRGAKRVSGSRLGPREQEAEVFAAELLMPERAVRERFRTLYGVDYLWVGSFTVNEAMHHVGRSFSHSSDRWPDFKAAAEALAVYELPEHKSLARFFDASMTACGRRLRELGLIRP